MTSSKLTWVPIALLTAGGLAGGWFLKSSLNRNETSQSDPASSAIGSSSSNSSLDNSRSSQSARKSRSGQGAPRTADEKLGEYQIDSDGRRIYVGPRDVTVLNRMAKLHTRDVMGQIEVMGQISQMNPEELAEAWKEFSKNDPVMGSTSQLLATQMLTRLRAAGIECEIPPNWSNIEKSISTALEIDDARRNPDAYREKLLAGEELSIHQRRGMFRALAAEDPAAAAKLWIENSTSEQQLEEAKSLASLMLDPSARGSLLELISQTTDSDKLGTLITDLGSEWAAQDPAAFEDWIDSTGDPQLKSEASFLILNMQAMTDPVKSIAFAQTMEEEYRGDAIRQSMQTLARHNWEDGAEVISKITDPEDRKAAIAGYGFLMAAKQFDDFASWRDQLPPEEQDVANEKAFVPFATQDPDGAQAWLDQRPEGPAKDKLRVQLMFSGQYETIDDRIRLINTINSPEQRARAIGMTLQNIEVTNLEEIRRVLDAVSPAPVQ